MKKIDFKKLSIALFAITMLAMPVLLLAATSTIDVPRPAIVGSNDLTTIVGNVINILLTLIGIVCIILIVFGGFKYMTASGKEDAMKDAKGIMIGAIIGLIIVFIAWAASTFIINNLQRATGV